jgi:hypothetical protein
MKVISLITLVLSLFLAPYPSQAQSVAKTSRVGILTLTSVPNPALEAFRQGRRDLGYVEGQNIALEYRFLTPWPLHRNNVGQFSDTGQRGDRQ